MNTNINETGGVISINQLELTTPGLIDQLKGTLTKYWYITATIWIDHFICLSFVHLQNSLTCEDTLPFKQRNLLKGTVSQMG